MSLNSTNTYGMYAGRIWGPGGVRGGSRRYRLRPSTGNATGDPAAYWTSLPAAGPGSLGDYFNALVRVGVEVSGSSPDLTVLDWFQGSSFTQSENDADLDFGGSSPLMLPPINGRQLVAFVPKDGNVFLLDSQNLGEYSIPLTSVKFGDSSDDTKVAIAFMQTPSARGNIRSALTRLWMRGIELWCISWRLVPSALKMCAVCPHEIIRTLLLQASLARPTKAMAATPLRTLPVNLFCYVLRGIRGGGNQTRR